MIRKSQLKTPSTIFGTPRWLFSEYKQDQRIEQEGDPGREQHRALFPCRPPDHGAKQELLYQGPDRR